MNTKIRYPQVGGLDRVKKNLKEILEKEPSEEFVRIINENNRLIDEEDQRDREKADRAARPRDAEF